MHSRRIVIEGDTAKLELTQGQLTVIDLEDLERVKHHSWCYSLIKNTGYGAAVARVNGKTTLLHRFIAGANSRSQVVDHLNGDPLDNRKANLRLGTQAVNARNKAKFPSLSGYRGLNHLPGYSKPWQLYPRIGGKLVSLGCYANTALPALLFDAIQVKIANAMGLAVSLRVLNFPGVADQTLIHFDDWLKAVLTDEQLSRLDSAIEAHVRRANCDSTYLYVAIRKDLAVKIGVSRDPVNRVRIIRCGSNCKGYCPETTLVWQYRLATATEAYNLEASLHKHFKDFRLEGEWFQISPDEVKTAVLHLTSHLAS